MTGRTLPAALLALAAGCAAQQGLDAAGPAARASAGNFVHRGEAAEARGDHARASAYFEAALDAGADEASALPRLVSSLVRAGELRRALAPISRLRELRPGDRAVEALDAAVRAALGGGGGTAEVPL